MKWKNTLQEKNLQMRKRILLDEEKLKELSEEVDKEMLAIEAEKQKHLLAMEEKMKMIREKQEEMKKLTRIEL